MHPRPEKTNRKPHCVETGNCAQTRIIHIHGNILEGTKDTVNLLGLREKSDL